VSEPALTTQALAQRLLDALPQTQCTRCGYPDCAAYAHALSLQEADINQCPPGGAEGIVRLAHITGRTVKPLDPTFGMESPRTVAFIDEAWCIGCTLCIDACPTDAIFGSNKRMHTVIEAYCTGCELCLPVCPVDCIALEPAQVPSPNAAPTGWSAWSQNLADTARSRYQAAKNRRAATQSAHEAAQTTKAQNKLNDLAAHSRITDPQVLDQKKAVIQAAMERARLRKASNANGPTDTQS
jgi:electron transport complex protein RnfB